MRRNSSQLKFQRKQKVQGGSDTGSLKNPSFFICLLMGVTKKLSRTSISYSGTFFGLWLYRGHTGAPNRRMGLGGKKNNLGWYFRKFPTLAFLILLELVGFYCWEQLKYFYGVYLQALGKFSRHPNTGVIVEILVYMIFTSWEFWSFIFVRALCMWSQSSLLQ